MPFLELLNLVRNKKKSESEIKLATFIRITLTCHPLSCHTRNAGPKSKLQKIS